MGNEQKCLMVPSKLIVKKVSSSMNDETKVTA